MGQDLMRIRCWEESRRRGWRRQKGRRRGREEAHFRKEDGREKQVGIKHTDVLTCHAVKKMNMTVECAWHMLEDARLKKEGTLGVRGAIMEESLPIC